jgi:hypothetical protein
METNQGNCVLCGDKVDELSRTFEQRLVDDTDFCAPCWNEIMHEGHESTISYRPYEGVKVPWVS